jgi:tryptophan-rich sensory protein
MLDLAAVDRLAVMVSARSAVVGGAVTATAAVLGNAFVGKDSLSWFRGLKAPPWQLPMPGFVMVAAAYYVIMAVLARGIDRRDAGTIGWAVAVLAGNEAWNGLLFGRRSPRAAFIGVLAFLVPLAGLQQSVRRDGTSCWILSGYTIYVIGYDVPWAYRLWRLNPGPTRS